MPKNTGKSKSSEEDTGRRRSARLADLDKDKPKESPKVAKKTVEKKSPKKKTEKKAKEVIEDNHVEDIIVENKGDSEHKEDDKETNEKSIEEKEDFVVVHKEDVPSPSSKEVSEAISAQGKDGELLVNFVQVTHDDVPAAKDIPITLNGNGVLTNNISEKPVKDTSKEDTKVAETQKSDTVISAAV